jgi:hypothetical protein
MKPRFLRMMGWKELVAATAAMVVAKQASNLMAISFLTRIRKK